MARKVTLKTNEESAELPPPGVHEGVPFDLYCQWPALNQSVVKHGRRSMRHLKAALDGMLEKGQSDAQRMGRALHCKLLEPDVFDKEWVTSEGCCATLASGKNKGNPCGKTATLYEASTQHWFCGTHAKGKEVVEPTNMLSWEQMDDIDAMCDAMKADPAIALLRQQGGREVSVVWEVDGRPAKARLDKLSEAAGGWPPTIVDLKKVRVGGGAEEAFLRAAVDYGYDIQAAWYQDAVHATTGERPVFVWVAVEEEYPYAINVLQASQSMVDFGRERYEWVLERMAQCEKVEHWPGYMRGTRAKKVDMPPWFVERERERMRWL
jgi:hypothetical protein